MLDFQQYEVVAAMHSDYLAYAFNHIGSLPKNQAPRTFSELHQNLASITTSFAATKVHPNNTYTIEQFTQQVMSSSIAFSTRSENNVKDNLPLIVTELFSKIDELPEGLSTEQYKNAIEEIVREKSLITNNSDEDFRTLAITAAICIDSYKYWSENYPAWQAQIFGDTTTRGFWGDVWQEVKRLSKEDAAYGAVSAPGAMLTGPMALNVIFASAGVGSVYEGFKPYL